MKWDPEKELTVHLVLIHDHLVGEAEKYGFFDFDGIKSEVRLSLYALHFSLKGTSSLAEILV